MGRVMKSGNMLLLSRINVALTEYTMANGVEPSYIVMNEFTLEILEVESNGMVFIKDPKYSVFEGIPIAVCEKLSVGEFEVV